MFATAVAALGLALGPATAPAPAAEPPPHVYVVVLDGLKPAEVGTLTPTLSGLRDEGTWYEQARAVFPAETLPNHVAMMTGVRPERNGIVGNEFWQPNGTGEPSFYMDDPSLLDADTLTTRLENACGAAIATATVQSKTYLHGVFRGEEPRAGDPSPQREADFHWAPPFYVPISEHAPDALTMDGFRTWVREQPATLPRFAFVNLGDIDRSGHADVIGGATSGLSTPARQAAIEDTDAQLGMLVDDLRESGTWNETVLVLTSDHGMDWGPYEQQVEIEAALTAAGYRLDPTGSPSGGGSGDFNVVGGGGTGAVYAEDEADVPDMTRVLDALPGVAFVGTREPVPGLGNPALREVGMDHPRNGDIVVFVEPHWRIGDGNPLPGNHGHPATQQSLLLVTGGHPLLRDAAARVTGDPVFDPDRKLFSSVGGGPGNLSVAPTVAGLLGLGEPGGGYDGEPLSVAFEDYAFLPHRPCEAAAPPPDVAVSITDQPDPVRRNGLLTYTVAVENGGASGASEVTLRDQLPETVRLRSVRTADGSCAASAASVECDLASLAAGERATVTIEVRADRSGTITNRATATTAEPEVERANNEAVETTAVLPAGG